MSSRRRRNDVRNFGVDFLSALSGTFVRTCNQAVCCNHSSVKTKRKSLKFPRYSCLPPQLSNRRARYQSSSAVTASPSQPKDKRRAEESSESLCFPMERPEIQLAQSVTRNFSIDVEYDYDEFGISRQSYVTIPGLDNSGTEGVNWSIGAMRLRGDLGLGTMGPHIVIGVRCANSFWDKIDGFEKMQLTVRNWPTDFDEAMDNEQAEREERWRGFRHTTIGYTAEELYADRLRDIHSHGIIFGLPPPSDSPQGFFENRLVLQLDITCKSIAPPPPPTPPIPLSIPAGYTGPFAFPPH